MQSDERIYCGFKPVFDSNSRVLVLGSFPSVKSRETGFYYGNKQNRFWRVLGEAYGCVPQTTEEKIRLCLDNRIALWDIVASCQISGSMDADIKNYELANLDLVLSGCRIEKILCNGQKAFQLTKKAYGGNIPVFLMPSTSPANVRFDKSVWLKLLPSE